MLVLALRRAATQATNIARPRQARLHALPHPVPLATRHVARLALPASQLQRAFCMTPAKAEQASGAGSSAGPPPPPKRKLPRFRTVLRYSAYIAGSTVLGVFVLTGSIFLHDAFTYNEKVRNPSARDSYSTDPTEAHRGCPCGTTGSASRTRWPQEPSNCQSISLGRRR